MRTGRTQGSRSDGAAQIRDDILACFIGFGAAEKMNLGCTPTCPGPPNTGQVEARKCAPRRLYREDLRTTIAGSTDENIRRGPDGRATDQTIDDMANTPAGCRRPRGRAQGTLDVAHIHISCARLIQNAFETTLHDHIQHKRYQNQAHTLA